MLMSYAFTEVKKRKLESEGFTCFPNPALYQNYGIYYVCTRPDPFELGSPVKTDTKRKERLAKEISRMILGKPTLKEKLIAGIPILVKLLVLFVGLALLFSGNPDMWQKFKKAMKGERSEIAIGIGPRGYF